MCKTVLKYIKIKLENIQSSFKCKKLIFNLGYLRLIFILDVYKHKCNPILSLFVHLFPLPSLRNTNVVINFVHQGEVYLYKFLVDFNTLREDSYHCGTLYYV